MLVRMKRCFAVIVMASVGGLGISLAQDAQRLVDQINRIAEQLERDPARFLFGNRTQGINAE